MTVDNLQPDDCGAEMTVDLYDLVPCSRCKALPGESCNMRTLGGKYHCPRQDRAARERNKLTLPVFDYADRLAIDFAAAQGISDQEAIHCAGLLRDEIYRQARSFMRNGKMVPPTFSEVRRLLSDESIAIAFAVSKLDYCKARRQISSGLPLRQLELAGHK